MSTSFEDLAHDVAGDAEDVSTGPRKKTQEAPTPGTPQQRQQPTLPEQPDEKPLSTEEIIRPAIGAALTTLGAAFLVGGMFTGFTARAYAGVGGLIGVILAVWAARATKRETLIQAISLVGILLVGLVALVFGGGFGNLTNMSEVLGDAVSNARLTRPPVFFDTGWRAILPWTIGLVGYTAAWVGSIGRRPALGILIPIPVIAFSAIAQPPEAQVPAGIVAFATFTIALAVIYRADRGEGEGVSTSFEIKRAAKSSPYVVGGIVALVLLSQTGFLFPDPLYDPTQRAQLPQAVSLESVRDRVLFETQGDFTGPWRTGILSVYDGEAWRLPPYSESDFTPAPDSGLLGEVFNNPVPPDVRASVTVQGLEGVVLPLPARMHGIRAVDAPQLVVDPLAETVRVDVGQVESGLRYDAVFSLLPTEDALRVAGDVRDPEFFADWTDTGGRDAPDSVLELLAQAPRDNLWDRLDFMRKQLLDTVTATGQGLPTEVPPEKVDDMLAGTQEGTPYEIVAAQALIARWTGVPARIGYGFDGGKEVGSVREFRPLHGSAWLEVYFQDSGWFPVTGLPKKAKQSLGSDDTQRDAEILPSDDIAVQLFIPLRQTPSALFFKQAQKVVLLVLPILAFLGLIWLLWPVVYKARRTSRRRQWALGHGPAARIAVAYTELRDLATDLGVGDPYATPLQYVDRTVEDEEHRELAWLVTRTLWGDLRHRITDNEVYASEELSRALRRRIFEAQPFTIRGISFVSRLSLRDPYAPELLSPPVPKLTPSAVLGKGWRRVARAFTLPSRRKRKELADEVIGSA